MFNVGDLICNTYFIYEVFDIKDEINDKIIYIRCVYDMYKHKHLERKENFIYTISNKNNYYGIKDITFEQYLEYLKARETT